MDFPQPLVRGRFLSREKRFTVHVRLDDGREVAAHTNNTGRMTGCLAPQVPVWLSPAGNPARKLAWSLEIVESPPDGEMVGVNTALANRLAAEAIGAGLIPGLMADGNLRREVPFPWGGSRVDLVLANSEARIWIEVKNVSLVTNGHGRFPDAPTSRGRKHLQDLMATVRAGDRAALILCSQRGDARTIGPADDIDPEYGILLRQAVAAGVELHGIGAQVTARGVRPARLLSAIL